MLSLVPKPNLSRHQDVERRGAKVKKVETSCKEKMATQTIQALIGKNRFESFHNDCWGRSLILKRGVEAAEVSYWHPGVKAECGYGTGLQVDPFPANCSSQVSWQGGKYQHRLESLSRLSDNDSCIALHILACGSLRLKQPPFD
jgi:hypothetical protein